jgi:hypothetical protein
MKWLIPVLVLALASCTTPFDLNTQGYEILTEDLDMAWKFVSSHQYRSDVWIQSPMEFEKLGGGCCFGFATDLVYHLGPEASFVICKMKKSAPLMLHCLVKYRGEYIEPQIYGRRLPSTKDKIEYIVEEKNYFDTMNFTSMGGLKSISSDPVLSLTYDNEPVPGKE